MCVSRAGGGRCNDCQSAARASERFAIQPCTLLATSAHQRIHVAPVDRLPGGGVYGDSSDRSSFCRNTALRLDGHPLADRISSSAEAECCWCDSSLPACYSPCKFFTSDADRAAVMATVALPCLSSGGSSVCSQRAHGSSAEGWEARSFRWGQDLRGGCIWSKRCCCLVESQAAWAGTPRSRSSSGGRSATPVTPPLRP